MEEEEKFKDSEEKVELIEKELGFEESFAVPGVRLMNKDGSLNVHFVGSKRFRKWNLYKRFINMSALNFFLSILSLYIILNLLFATFYYCFGENGLSISNSEFSWLNCFWFSCQTFTTVGYGHISPSSMIVNIVSGFEAFIGLIFFAIATGVVYGRFTNSKVDLRFSENILINYQGKCPTLTCRLANAYDSELSDLEAILIMSYTEKKGDRVGRRYKKLTLELGTITILSTSWTLEHKILDNSPCNLLLDKKKIQGLEFLVFISAFDEIYDQKVKFRTSYLGEEVIDSAMFEPITSYSAEKTVVDLEKLSSYQKI